MKNVSENMRKEAAQRLFVYIENNSPENIMLCNEKSVAKVAVTVDGTWQKRGFSSKIGVVFIISVDTGEVLDAMVKSLECHECWVHKTSTEYETWYKGHKQNCNINHVGSSGIMEKAAATEILLRSIEIRNLMYTIFVGDEDTDCFANVRNTCLEFNENYVVEKEECVGHIQKRLGTALREYKKKKKGVKLLDGKGVGGTNRLTDKFIDKMQNHYGEAIRSNCGNLEKMVNSIWAIFKHMVCENKLSPEKQHDKCPRKSWCKFWANKSAYTEQNRLPSVFFLELKPIFERLSKETLLGRCLKG